MQPTDYKGLIDLNGGVVGAVFEARPSSQKTKVSTVGDFFLPLRQLAALEVQPRSASRFRT
jgi:hypothetical protein